MLESAHKPLAQFRRYDRPEDFSLFGGKYFLILPGIKKMARVQAVGGNEFSLSVLGVYRREIPFGVPLAALKENGASSCQ
jgi:hypothetical protein